MTSALLNLSHWFCSGITIVVVAAVIVFVVVVEVVVLEVDIRRRCGSET